MKNTIRVIFIGIQIFIAKTVWSFWASDDSGSVPLMNAVLFWVLNALVLFLILRLGRGQEKMVPEKISSPTKIIILIIAILSIAFIFWANQILRAVFSTMY